MKKEQTPREKNRNSTDNTTTNNAHRSPENPTPPGLILLHWLRGELQEGNSQSQLAAFGGSLGGVM